MKKRINKAFGIFICTLTLSLLFSAVSFAASGKNLVTGLKTTNIGDTKLTITWTYNAANEGFKIYHLDRDDQALYYVSTVKTNSYTATGLTPASENTFAISVLTKNGKTVTEGPLKIYSCHTGVGQVKNLKATSNTAEQQLLSWSKVKGAAGYEIYYYNASKKQYSLLGTKTETTAKLTNIKGGTNYKYRIRAFCFDGDGDKICGKYSAVLSITAPLAKPTAIKSKSAEKSIALTWNKVTGAQSYKVFVYDTAKKSYKTLAVVSGEKYTASALKDGTVYKFIIRAYSEAGAKGVQSPNSSEYSCATKPVATKLSKVNDASGNGAVKLSWTKVARCDGYLVYFSDSKNGTYKLKAKLNGNGNLTYTVSSLKNGANYYFKVIAYKAVGSKLESGKNSNIISSRA